MNPPPSKIHIIAFDIPWPANYGGVIDIFHKIRCLHLSGINIILHCYQYGRHHARELNDLCESVHYYPRDTGWSAQLSHQPYIVKSRNSALLKERLLQDHHPILCEGLHSTSFLASPLFRGRTIYVRTTNVEHQYYLQLARREPHFIKRLYYRIEAHKLRHYEKVLSQATQILAISPADQEYFEQKFGKDKVTGLYAFHPNDQVISQPGSGDFFLFHGRLDIPENHQAVLKLLPLFKGWTGKPLKVAGMNPPGFLQREIEKYPKVTLIANPSREIMDQLQADAHAHLLITHQETGIKLKLLTALYRGRFVVVNHKMVNHTGLEELCISANTREEIQEAMTRVASMTFNEQDMVQRQLVLEEHYSNQKNTQKLLALLTGGEW